MELHPQLCWRPAAVSLLSLTPSPRDHKDLRLQPSVPHAIPLAQPPAPAAFIPWEHSTWAEQGGRWANWRPSPCPPPLRIQSYLSSPGLQQNTSCRLPSPLPIVCGRHSPFPLMPSDLLALPQCPTPAGTLANAHSTPDRKPGRLLADLLPSLCFPQIQAPVLYSTDAAFVPCLRVLCIL